MDDGKYIFLSYSREDLTFARRLRDDLVNAGFNIWMDKTHIPGGHHWDDTIEEALSKTEVLVVLISPDSVKSQNVRDEMDYALDEEHLIPIVPVMYKDVKLPLRWRRLQYIDLHENNYRNKLPIVIDAIHLALHSHDQQIPPPEPKEEKTKTISLPVIFATVLLGSVLLWVWYKNKTESEHTVVPDNNTPAVLQKKSIPEKPEVSMEIEEQQIKPDNTVAHNNPPEVIIPEKKELEKRVEKITEDVLPKTQHIRKATPVRQENDHKPKTAVLQPHKSSRKMLDIDKFTNIPYDDDGVVAEFIQKLNLREPVVLQIISYKERDDLYDKAFSKADNIAYLLRDRGLKRENLEVKVMSGRGRGIVYKIVKEMK